MLFGAIGLPLQASQKSTSSDAFLAQGRNRPSLRTRIQSIIKLSEYDVKSAAYALVHQGHHPRCPATNPHTRTMGDAYRAIQTEPDDACDPREGQHQERLAAVERAYTVCASPCNREPFCAFYINTDIAIRLLQYTWKAMMEFETQSSCKNFIPLQFWHNSSLPTTTDKTMHLKERSAQRDTAPRSDLLIATLAPNAVPLSMRYTTSPHTITHRVENDPVEMQLRALFAAYGFKTTATDLPRTRGAQPALQEIITTSLRTAYELSYPPAPPSHATTTSDRSASRQEIPRKSKQPVEQDPEAMTAIEKIMQLHPPLYTAPYTIQILIPRSLVAQCTYLVTPDGRPRQNNQNIPQLIESIRSGAFAQQHHMHAERLLNRMHAGIILGRDIMLNPASGVLIRSSCPTESSAQYQLMHEIRAILRPIIVKLIKKLDLRNPLIPNKETSLTSVVGTEVENIARYNPHGIAELSKKLKSLTPSTEARSKL